MCVAQTYHGQKRIILGTRPDEHPLLPSFKTFEEGHQTYLHIYWYNYLL